MFKKLITGACLLSTFSIAYAQQAPLSFNKSLYTESGCAKSYYRKAKATNRIMGATLGGASIALSTVMPLGWVFALGGIGAVGESAFDLGHEKFNQQFQANFKVKSVIEKKPLVRYPMARQYFDILNSLELAKVLKNNNTDLTEYLKIYIRSSALTAQVKEAYKECKSQAKLVGISKSELKDVEKGLLDYLMQMESEDGLTSEIEKGKQSFAQCILELKLNDGDQEVYPVADLLLAQYELKNTGLLNWRLKGVTRQYVYTYKKAQEENRDINVDQYFETLDKLDNEKKVCENYKKPLNRKKLTKEIISLIAE